MKFSGDVEFPIAWRQKFDFDQARKLHGIEGARHLAPGSFLGLSQEAANDGTEQGLDPDNISIESLDPRELKFNIKFNDPTLISMGDQSNNDKLNIAFNEPLYGTNGELLDTENLPANADGVPQPKFGIQPMVDSESEEQKSLNSATEGIYTVGLILMLVQFIVTLLASTSFGYFWELINSQVNYCYLPLMSVNPPGQVSFYLEVLIVIVTLDPIPMHAFYKAVPMFDFDVVAENNSKPMFARIGLVDRNVIDVLGSMFLFALIFLFIVVCQYALS